MPRTPDLRFALALTSVSLIGPLSIHMFLPLMPAVKAGFDISSALVGLTFSVTLFVIAIATLLYGGLSDRFGRRPVLLAGLTLFLAGTLLSALAPGIGTLFAGRLLQALGAGCGVTLARAMARDAYGADRLVQVIALLTAAYTLGPMTAPLIGGTLLDHFGWRSAFWFAFVAGCCILAGALFVLEETHVDRRPIEESFIRSHWRLLSTPRFLAYVMQSGLSSGTFMAMATAAPFMMRDLLGRSATEFGLYFLCFPVGFCSGTFLASRLTRRFRLDDMVLFGSGFTALAVIVQSAFILSGELNPVLIFVPGLLVTFGQGLALPNAQAGAIRVDPTRAGTAAGLGVFVQMMTGALFSQAYSLLANRTPVPMVAVALTGALLTVAAGIIPTIMNRRAARSQSAHSGT
jgi:DHA1 family bicyclomycin/chloramphenicol resistance-like MFS transporter